MGLIALLPKALKAISLVMLMALFAIWYFFVVKKIVDE